jgi:hypothetical protein
MLYGYFLYIPFYVSGTIISSLAFLSFYPRIFEPIVLISILNIKITKELLIVNITKFLVLLMLISLSTIFFDEKFMNEYINKQY